VIATEWLALHFSCTTHAIDLRVGGMGRFDMLAPDGTYYPNRRTFLQVKAPELLVFDHGSDIDDDPNKFRVIDRTSLLDARRDDERDPPLEGEVSGISDTACSLGAHSRPPGHRPRSRSSLEPCRLPPLVVLGAARELLSGRNRRPAAALRASGCTRAARDGSAGSWQRRTARSPLLYEACGVNLHAERVVDGRDRAQLERLCRYLARPPLSHDGLTELPDGRLRLAFKKHWRDGTEAIVLTPMDLIARSCAIVPPPRMHLTRFHGVFAPAAKLRAEVVPRRPLDPELTAQEQLSLFTPAGNQPAPLAQTESAPQPAGRHNWASLLKRVFAVDVTVCDRCQGRMRIAEVALTTEAIARVLARHGQGPMPPPSVQRPVPGQLGLPDVAMH
jgi:hypothetical protein